MSNNVRQPFPITDEDNWWNTSHNELNRAAGDDVLALYEWAKSLFKGKGVCGCLK